MEETKNMEQPNTSETLETVGDQKAQNENVEKISEVSGSNFGKFKDPATLLSAYESLEKEFTKKSQKLAELEKQNKNIQEIKNANLLSDNENTHTETANEDKTPLQSKAKYEDEDWKTYAENFLKENQNAKQYSKEIFEIISNDKVLASSPNCLEYAFAIAKSKHETNTESLLSDQTFISEHILNNENIKEQIIKQYLCSLSKGSEVPRFISGTTQNISVTTPDAKPKTLKDASIILKKLLNN